MERIKKIEKEAAKLQAMVELGEDEYARTHSNCCDDLITQGGICSECKENCISQYEEGK